MDEVKQTAGKPRHVLGPGPGRPKGSPNKSTAEIKALAMSHAPAALKELARLATDAETETARVAACNAILDRAMGKPKQALVGGDEDDRPITVQRIELVGVRPNGDG